MRLPEFKSKEIFKAYGIRTPDGVCLTKEQYTRGDINFAAMKIPGILKAQNLIGGRGKAGGVLVYNDIEALRAKISALFEEGFSGNAVNMILAEEIIPIERETYLCISIDRRAGEFVLMSSGTGGMDIESVNPSEIRRAGISNLIGLQKFQASYAAKPIAEAGAKEEEAMGVIESLYRIVRKEKALLAEINPLVICPDGSVCAADAKIMIDDNAAGKDDKSGQARQKTRQESPLKSAADALGVNIVELGGNIAVISNGAGEGMSTLDQIVRAGGELSLWVDLGGGALSAKPEVLDNFIECVMDTKPDVLLFTAFFQIGKCDFFAESFRKIYMKRKETKGAYIPQIILRLDGRNAKEAKALSGGTDIRISDSSQEACRTAARLSRGEA